MDTRTRVEKLAAMAEADESPHEASIARQRLQAMGNGGQLPPRRPPVAPGMPGWPPGWTSTTSGSVTNGVSYFSVRWGTG